MLDNQNKWSNFSKLSPEPSSDRSQLSEVRIKKQHYLNNIEVEWANHV